MQVSGATGIGVQEVLFAIIRILDAAKAENLEASRVKTDAHWAP